jgi:hypothetical protein
MRRAPRQRRRQHGCLGICYHRILCLSCACVLTSGGGTIGATGARTPEWILPAGRSGSCDVRSSSSLARPGSPVVLLLLAPGTSTGARRVAGSGVAGWPAVWGRSPSSRAEPNAYTGAGSSVAWAKAAVRASEPALMFKPDVGVRLGFHRRVVEDDHYGNVGQSTIQYPRLLVS